jgi:hypothetical protein
MTMVVQAPSGGCTAITQFGDRERRIRMGV